MRTTKEYIALIAAHDKELRASFGIQSLRIFGSVSRHEQKEGSDIDVCVDMEPKTYLVVRLKRFLEDLLQCSVDVVRMHKHINPYLLEEINKDGIYVIR
ncbi:MAG TPA: DNA polymerase subunit beta [Prevotella sp.]|mgnify:CR=1 FL=1|nr:DNA polymerase subunit beta [Prevotella sp.]